MEIPVILIGSNLGVSINEFITSIPQDVVVFIDEYEKTFKGNVDTNDYNDEGEVDADSTLLSLMDGTYKTVHRRMFLLTTNRQWVNENMINRPGRVRYIKDFTDLPVAQVNEILDDCLKDKEFKDSILSYIKRLKIITVDIVKAIIQEVNIYNTTPENCCKELNTKFKEEEYAIIKLIPGTAKKKASEEIMADSVEHRFIHHLIGEKTNCKGKVISYQDLYLQVTGKDENTYTVRDINSSDPTKNFKIKIKKVPAYHRYFM